MSGSDFVVEILEILFDFNGSSMYSGKRKRKGKFARFLKIFRWKK